MISKILNSGGFNTLIYDDSYAKICLITSIILEFQNQHHDNKITYIDLDAVFTAYAKARLIPSIKIEKTEDHIYQSNSNNLKIYLPDEDTLDFIIVDVIKSMQESSLVIFDSINSFYNLYYNKISPKNRLKIGSLNQMLYFFLMLLLKHTSIYKIPFIVTSMIRYNRKGIVTSNRLLSNKSSVNFYVKVENLNDLSLTILSHPTINQKNIILKDKILNFNQ